MAAKHFLIFYQKGVGTYIITEPRSWARENYIEIDTSKSNI